MTACERCHRRRIKCDASQRGLPCSSCSKSNSSGECRLLRSKKIRGRDGRYKEPESNETPITSAPTQYVPDHRRRDSEAAKHAPTRSVIDPQVNDELAQLCDPGHINSNSRRQGELPPSRSVTSSSESARQVNDSWYASYVLSHCALLSNPGSLGRPVFDSQSIARPTPSTRNAAQLAGSPDLPASDLSSALIEAYFTTFHNFCPILRRHQFMTSLYDGTLSLTLLRCVLFVASIHCDPSIFYRLGYRTRTEAGDDLFSKASAAFNADDGMSRADLVLCSYLLHYWFGKPTTYQDSAWWLSTAIRSAQFLNYHRDVPDASPTERSNARRIWWCLYIRDRQVSLSMSTPMTINDLDSDISPPKRDDFDAQCAESAMYIVLQADLNRSASLLFYRHCSPARLQLAKDPAIFAEAVDDIARTLEDWLHEAQASSLWHLTSPLSLLLKVCYHYYTINLSQRLRRVRSHEHSQGTPQNTLDAAAAIQHAIDDSFLHFAPQQFPMIYVSAILSAIAVLMDDMKANGQTHAQLGQRLRPYLLHLRQLESVYVLAGWILKLFLSILNKSSKSPKKRNADVPTDGEEVSFDESGFAFFLRTLPSSPLNAGHLTQLSTPFDFDFSWTDVGWAEPGALAGNDV